MAITTAGVTALAADGIGESVTEFNNANAHIGAGSGNTAFSAAHTDLQGASKTRKPMEATYPSRSGLAVTLRALFGTGDANYAWEEWAVFNAAAAGTMLSRKVESLGTKTVAQAWQVTATLTFAAA